MPSLIVLGDKNGSRHAVYDGSLCVDISDKAVSLQRRTEMYVCLVVYDLATRPGKITVEEVAACLQSSEQTARVSKLARSSCAD